MTRSSRRSELTRVDLPTFWRPRMASWRGFSAASSGSSLPSLSLFFFLRLSFSSFLFLGALLSYFLGRLILLLLGAGGPVPPVPAASSPFRCSSALLSCALRFFPPLPSSSLSPLPVAAAAGALLPCCSTAAAASGCGSSPPSLLPSSSLLPLPAPAAAGSPLVCCSASAAAAGLVPSLVRPPGRRGSLRLARAPTSD